VEKLANPSATIVNNHINNCIKLEKESATNEEGI